MDQCEECLAHWGEKSPEHTAYYREKIRQWKLAGRPEIKWPKVLAIPVPHKAI
jgi:hypothetical protein